MEAEPEPRPPSPDDRLADEPEAMDAEPEEGAAALVALQSSAAAAVEGQEPMEQDDPQGGEEEDRGNDDGDDGRPSEEGGEEEEEDEEDEEASAPSELAWFDFAASMLDDDSSEERGGDGGAEDDEDDDDEEDDDDDEEDDGGSSFASAREEAADDDEAAAVASDDGEEDEWEPGPNAADRDAFRGSIASAAADLEAPGGASANDDHHRRQEHEAEGGREEARPPRARPQLPKTISDPPTFPVLLNSASAPVSLGSSSSSSTSSPSRDYSRTLYCGRRLGRDAIPGSDGRCGPDDGPQCPDCKSLEVGGGGRLEVLRRLVPGLRGLVAEASGAEAETADGEVRSVLTLALRRSGGSLPAAAAYLKRRTGRALRVVDPPSLALPPLADPARAGGDGDDDDDDDASDADVATLRETLGLDPLSARVALRRHGGDVQRAAAFALDEPEALAGAAAEEREAEDNRRREAEERRTRHEGAVRAASEVDVTEELVDRVREMLREARGFPSLEDVDKEGKLMGEYTGDGRRVRRVVARGSGGDEEGACDEAADAFAVDGHYMVPAAAASANAAAGGRGAPQDRPAADSAPEHCLVCAGSVPSPACGVRLCGLCGVCEGCVQSPSPRRHHTNPLSLPDPDDADDDEAASAASALASLRGLEDSAAASSARRRRGPARRCPALRNGSHLHLHPLTFGLERRRTCHCDIGSGCGDVLWSCADCDFDVCASCLSRPAPDGYDRLSGTRARGRGGGSEDGSDSDNSDDESAGSDEDSDDDDDDDGPTGPASERLSARPLDPAAAERCAAARWEGSALSDPPPGSAIVGTGEACHGGAFVEGRPVQARGGGGGAGGGDGGGGGSGGGGWGDRREARRKLRGEAGGGAAGAGGTETKLTEDAEEALELFRSRKRAKEGETADASTATAPATTTLGLAVSAADLAHAEDLLHRARAVNGSDPLVHRELCRAVASGRLDLAGSLLLSEAFAPVAEAASSSSNEEPSEGGSDAAGGANDDHPEECWCGLPLDSDSCPDGSVGCLGGHAMHPSCASDLLLGGGACPTCRMPLYYPRVPEAEARVATELVEAELRRARGKGDGGGNGEGDEEGEEGSAGDLRVAVDDFVRIEPDASKCEAAQMAEPRSGGWSDDMAESCGKVGRITEVVREGGGGSGNGGSGGAASEGRVVAARVRTRNEEHALERIRGGSDYQCKNCSMYGPSPETGRRRCSRCRLCERCCDRSREDRFCPRTSHEWTWSPSLLRPAAPDVCDTALLDPEEAAARDAEGHVLRLRAELKAVAAAREALRARAEGMKVPHPIWTVVGPPGRRRTAGTAAAAQRQQRQLRLHKESVDALRHLWGKVSFADWTWARHLLTLVQRWDDDPPVAEHGRNTSADGRPSRLLLCAAAREGDLDTVARLVRRRNAASVAERLRWEDAVRATAEYVVSPTATVELRAFPSDRAPRTGYRLHPEARFRSRREMLDGDGNLWLQVDPKSFSCSSSGSSSSMSSSPTAGGKVVADLSDQTSSRALVGARVRRGPDWKWNDQDGGDGEPGAIVRVVRTGRVAVRWESSGSSPRQYEYRAGQNGKHDLLFLGAPPQAPQGWMSVRPAGHGSPCVAWRSRSALRCFCCGDGLVPPRPGRGRYSPARGDDVKEGDRLLVAATLEPVVVKGAGGGRVRCAFAFENGSAPPNGVGLADDCFDVWYRAEDLVLPRGRGEVWEEETLRVEGRMRTRREVVLLSGGDELAARRAWGDARRKSRAGGKHAHAPSAEEGGENGGGGPNFASCVRGHFLHARCLQGALLAGRECPAPGCAEPLCVPRVKRLRSDDATCCGGGAEGGAVEPADGEPVEGESELLRAAGALIRRSRATGGGAATAAADSGGDGDDGDDDAGMGDAGLPDLKMCPACCSGPLINQNCSDMKAHHGQCSRVAIRGASGGEPPCTSDGTFRVTPVDIAERIKRMSSAETVADVLPKCPTHGVTVMFNGCLSCGHLFTDTDWDEMPRWDPKAKSLLELDNKKRRAADLLARQVRTEVALYEFERDQFDRFGDMCKVCSDGDSADDAINLPPMPPPAVRYSRRGCGPSCDLQHFQDGECLVCGRSWGVHSGHTCPGGRSRGSFLVV